MKVERRIMSRDSDPVGCSSVNVRSKRDSRDRALADSSVEHLVNDIEAAHLISVALDCHFCWPDAMRESKGNGDLH
jgi:hypothetical protein